MSRRTVNFVLVAWLLVVWSAVILRIDRFPLTWVPMYSAYERDDTFGVRVEDQEEARRGFRVTHRDGTKSWVGHEELNVSKWLIRRLYYKRAFGKGAPKVRQANQNLGAFNRWLHGLGEGGERYAVDWPWRMFWTLNKTLGYEPDDPEFIVRIKARREYIYYDARNLRRVDRREKRADLHWKDEWRSRWDAGAL